jgi:hypothetical protein
MNHTRYYNYGCVPSSDDDTLFFWFVAKNEEYLLKLNEEERNE